MNSLSYKVAHLSVNSILGLVQAGMIAVPEIQRPFVWDATQVRDLMDSLYRGYPIGYLITWQNPDVRLKDGSVAQGKRILIDGQQRVTALMAAVLGRSVVDKTYRNKRIRVAFHPKERKFEVTNSAIERDSTWLSDLSCVFSDTVGIYSLVTDYCARNPDAQPDDVSRSLESLKNILSNHVGVIELSHDLDIETVTEIFVRVNSAGVALSQADFAMSKIAVNEQQGGPMLRKAIDFFCHLAAAPEFFATLQHDTDLVQSEYFANIRWLKNERDDLYDPTYTDVLRVSFATEFRRGRLKDLVALLAGRNFETRQYEESIVKDTFAALKQGVARFMNESNFKHFLLILKSAGFADASLIGSQNNVNFAYILYLTLKRLRLPSADIERHVRRWYVMSALTERYATSPESAIDFDMRMIESIGFVQYAADTYVGSLSDAFWDSALPQALEVSATTSPFFRVFLAAQVKLGHKGFLSADCTVKDLVEVKSNLHHVFPRDILRKSGMQRGQYNQVANYAICQSEINIAIGSREPKVYLGEMNQQCMGGPKRYGNITDPDQLRDNLRQHCIPDDEGLLSVSSYQEFLHERRKLMARVMRQYFDQL